jgi:hypothetical protein
MWIADDVSVAPQQKNRYGPKSDIRFDHYQSFSGDPSAQNLASG